jgi:hypothetical protein
MRYLLIVVALVFTYSGFALWHRAEKFRHSPPVSASEDIRHSTVLYGLVQVGTLEERDNLDPPVVRETKRLWDLGGPTLLVETTDEPGVLVITSTAPTPEEQVAEINGALKKYRDRLDHCHAVWQRTVQLLKKIPENERYEEFPQHLQKAEEAEEKLPRILQWAKID